MAITKIETGEVLYKGAVMKVFNGASYQIMSDIWGSCTEVEVFDVAENKPKKLSYNFCDNGNVWDKAKCEVDITDDVWEKYRAWQLQKTIGELVSGFRKDDAIVRNGDTVSIYKGKTAKGLEGKVVFIKQGGEVRYGWREVDTSSYCVALSDATVKATNRAGKEYDKHVDVVWVYARNCKKLNFTEPNMEAITQQAVERVDYHYKKKVPQAA
jgi:hypothetical protein